MGPLTIEGSRFGEVIKEKDLFRLSIRGYAALEEEVDEALAEAFAGGLPREIRRLPLKTRLALLVAPGRIPDEYSSVIAAVVRLRHDFAHGKIDEVTPARAKSLWQVTEPLLGPEGVEEVERHKGQPRVAVIATFTVAFALIRTLREVVRVRKEMERKGVRLEKRLRELLEDL